MTNTTQLVTFPKDLDPLRELMRGLLHEQCWRVALSYGDEVVLHFGARVPYTQATMASHEKGTWVFGTRGSDWELSNRHGTLVSSNDDPEVIRDKSRAIEGLTIVGFDISYPALGLTLRFSGGYRLVLSPDERDTELAFWELFAPDHLLIDAGPGPIWRCRRSDVPDQTSN